MGTLGDGPHIYVASLTDYNDGILHGVWIDATLGVEHMVEETQRMLAASPFAASDFAKRWGMVAEEYAIHDHSGFEGVSVHEFDSLERVGAVAQLIADHGEAAVAWFKSEDVGHLEPDEIESAFEDAYRGEYDSPSDYAACLTEDVGGVPDAWFAAYIDYEAMARDFELSGDVTFVQAGETTHVFANH